MTQLLEEVRPEADIESYEVFEEINSPNGENTAVLIRYQNESGCCSEPTGIFLIENGELSDQYEILAGALNHLALKNVEWETDTKASYDYAIIDEGGENSTKRYLELD